MKVTVEISNNNQLDRFINLVNKFERINPNIKLKALKIKFLYRMKSCGEFHDDEPNAIRVNPNKCDRTGEYSFYLICVHEYSHLLDKKFNMLEKYEREFENKEDRLYLTKNGKLDAIEELAEIITVYLTNPYLLKMISEKHFNFISSFFKSPTECDEKVFLSKYEKFSKRYKKKIQKLSSMRTI